MRVRGGGWGRETGGARKQGQRQGAEFTTEPAKPRTGAGKAGATSHYANRFAKWEGFTNCMEGGREQRCFGRLSPQRGQRRVEEGGRQSKVRATRPQPPPTFLAPVCVAGASPQAAARPRQTPIQKDDGADRRGPQSGGKRAAGKSTDADGPGGGERGGMGLFLLAWPQVGADKGYHSTSIHHACRRCAGHGRVAHPPAVGSRRPHLRPELQADCTRDRGACGQDHGCDGQVRTGGGGEVTLFCTVLQLPFCCSRRLGKCPCAAWVFGTAMHTGVELTKSRAWLVVAKPSVARLMHAPLTVSDRLLVIS